MDNELAIDLLSMIEFENAECKLGTWYHGIDGDMKEALEMAIEALKQQPCDDGEVKKIDEWKMHGKNAELWLVKGNLQVRYLGTIHNIPLSPIIPKSCEDVISRQAAIRLAEQGQVQGFEWQFKQLVTLPSVSTEKTGRWIKHDTGHSIYYDCSLCSCVAPCTEVSDSFIWKLSAYCPDCGAKMEGVEE